MLQWRCRHISASSVCEDVTSITVQMFFLSVSEQILHNIKQEYKRLQKRRHLDNAFQQADGCCPLDLQNIHSGSALPGSYQWHTLKGNFFYQLVYANKQSFLLLPAPRARRSFFARSWVVVPTTHCTSTLLYGQIHGHKEYRTRIGRERLASLSLCLGSREGHFTKLRL